MRSPFIHWADGLIFASFLTSGSAKPFLSERQFNQTCYKDATYQVLFPGNAAVKAFIDPFCSNLLMLPLATYCAATVTSTTQIPVGSISSTKTITTPTTIPSTTITVTETYTDVALAKRSAQLVARAAITSAPELSEARDVLNLLARRQAASPNINAAFDTQFAVSSACSCGSIDPGIDLSTTTEICTAPLSTKYLDGFIAVTVFSPTVRSGAKTVTVTTTESTTLKVPSTPTAMSSWTGSWGDWNLSTTAVEASTSTTADTSVSAETTPFVTTSETPGATTSYSALSGGSESTTSPTWSDSWFRNWTTTPGSAERAESTSITSASYTSTSDLPVDATSVMTTISQTASVTTSSAADSGTPAACPAKNGTIFSGPSNVKCTSYQYLCGVTYDDSDFYNIESYYPTPEQCTAACNAQNFGGPTPCVGIVWNTTSTGANCRTLRTTSMPMADSSSVALLLVPDSSCSSSSTSMMMTSTSGSSSLSVGPTWRPRSWSGNHTWSGKPTGTGKRPTGTWTKPYTTPGSFLWNDTSMTTTWGPSNLTSSTASYIYPNTTSTSMPYTSGPSNGTSSTASAIYTNTTSTSWSTTWGPLNLTSSTAPYPNLTSAIASTTWEPSNVTTSTTSYVYPNSSTTSGATYPNITSSRSHNYTASRNHNRTTTAFTTSFGTGVSPTSTSSNSSCPAAFTVTAPPRTVYASMVSTVTETITGNASYSTITETMAGSNMTITLTETETETASCMNYTVTSVTTDHETEYKTINTKTRTKTKITATVTETAPTTAEETQTTTLTETGPTKTSTVTITQTAGRWGWGSW